MKRIEVLLIGWEHECCGPRRVVGDDVTMKLVLGDSGDLYEDRHGDLAPGPGLSAPVRVSGRLVAMYESTQAAEDATGTDLTDYAFAFAIETGDPLPD